VAVHGVVAAPVSTRDSSLGTAVSGVHLLRRPKLQAERARIAAELAALRQRLQLLAVAINRLAAARQYLCTAAGAAMEAGDRCATQINIVLCV
jgi:hypothetical protein